MKCHKLLYPTEVCLDMNEKLFAIADLQISTAIAQEPGLFHTPMNSIQVVQPLITYARKVLPNESLHYTLTKHIT